MAENREIFIHHRTICLCRGWPRQNFAKVSDIHKTRMIGLPRAAKLW